MQSLAERLPSCGWWVAKTKPAKAKQFVSQLDRELHAEFYTPMSRTRRPIIPYVFIRALGRVDAWMCPGFGGWLQTNGTRATVPDYEFERFRSTIELELRAPLKREQNGKTRILLRVNANTEIRASL